MSKYEKYKLIILTISCLLFLFIFYNYSENGRYTIIENKLIVLDTKNGKIYIPKTRKYLNLSDFENTNKKNDSK